MRRLLLTGVVLATVAAAAAAQPHPGGILMGGGYPSNSTNYLNGLFRADRNGKFSTFVDTFTAQRPYYFQHTAMGLDNRSIVFGTRGTTSALYNLTYGVFRYDPATMKYTTIARSTMDFQTVYGVTAGPDGDWYVNAYGRDANSRTKYAVYRVEENGTWTTALTTLQLGYSQTFNYPIGRDVDTGGLLIPSSQSVGFFSYPVYALAPDGTVSTWNYSSGGAIATYGWTQEIATGDMLYMSGNYIYRVAKGRNGRTSTLARLSPETAYGMVLDNQSAARPLAIAYSYRQLSTFTTANLQFIDPVTADVVNTVNFIQANRLELIPYPVFHILHDRDRYIQTVKTGAGRWDLLFDFPAYPKKGYVAAAGLSGVRPGFVTGDGRHVWLNFDALVPLTVNNQIPFAFNPGPLVLDGEGRAKGSINLSFAPLPLGVTLHIVVAVIDPAAPGGIGFITEPYAFPF